MEKQTERATQQTNTKHTTDKKTKRACWRAYKAAPAGAARKYSRLLARIQEKQRGASPPRSPQSAPAPPFYFLFSACKISFQGIIKGVSPLILLVLLFIHVKSFLH